MTVICIIDADECAEDPCLNNGTCQNNLGSYECKCAPGWQGVNCKKGKYKNPVVSA